MAVVPPFPWFGGKREIVDLVWRRLGDVQMFVEPFAGSAVMALNRPASAKHAVIGDLNRHLINFWRAIRHQHAKVLELIDDPVTHIDLHARHVWLTEPERVAALDAQLADPEWPGDAKVAAWWAWGSAAWIGSGWCAKPVSYKLGHHGQIPELTHARGLRSMTNRGRVSEVVGEIAKRMHHVVAVHGSWERTLAYPAAHGLLGVFLDPPFFGTESVYAVKSREIVADVEAWCRANETRPKTRIALCGHAGDYDLPGWTEVVWRRPRRAFLAKGDGRECVWFSPGCVSQLKLF